MVIGKTHFGIDRIHPTFPWAADTVYRRGDSITPLNVDLDSALVADPSQPPQPAQPPTQ